jgi:glycosyltransferase involved in cell wall biosynthesis
MNEELTIIVPCYNEQHIIEQSFCEIENFLAHHPTFLVVFTDDKSTDSTLRILQHLRKQSKLKKRIEVIENHKNLGKGGAIKAGFALVKTKLVCFTDADLAYHLSNILLFTEHSMPGRLLIANRLHPQSCCHISPSFFSYIFFRHLLSRAFNRLVRCTLLPNALDVQAGLKMGYKNDFVEILPKTKTNGFSFDLELLLNFHYQKMEIVDLPVTYRYLTDKSSINVLRDGSTMLCNFLQFLLRKIKGDFR